MARTWLQIRVELEGGGGIDCDPPPGRIMMVGPGHTFADLAEAIEPPSPAGTCRTCTCSSCPTAARSATRIPTSTSRTGSITPRSRWPASTFDLGDNWRLLGQHPAAMVDPLSEYGPRPRRPVPIWGWGSIPDCLAVHGELAARGADMLAPPFSPPWGGHRFFVRDPDGHLMEVEQPA